MRVVIDTNVLVSAALKDRDPEAIIVFVVSHSDFEWMATPEIIQEYKEVLARPKFGLPQDLLDQWDRLLSSLITIIQDELPINFPQDPKDAKFLACALAAHAEWLITGDRDFQHAKRMVHTTIVSVSMFKKLVCDALT